MNQLANKTALVTGASSGIGAVYADRFAKRGYDLVLVARDHTRMEALAERLRRETGVAVDILQADLTDAGELAQVEERLRTDTRIGILVNNAGVNVASSFVDQSPDEVAKIISLNITALTRLASAVAPRFAKTGDGAIVNIGSVVGLAPEFGMTVYGATKAFVLFLTQGLQLELGSKGVKDHTQETPWTNLQLAYFAGYAMWTYLTSPFTFTLPGYEVEEMEPWQENGETWRRLQVTFAPYIATHSKVQTFYIDKDGLIRRHDYDVEISGGVPGVHYLSDHTEVSGIIVPTKRLVYIRQPDLSPLKEPLIVSIQLSDIKFSELEPAIHFQPSGNELVSGTL